MSQPLKVAIQGDRASFHEIAAKKYYTDPIDFIYCQSFNEVFNLLASQRADKAFVAASNTSHGLIEEVQSLMKEFPVVVDGEYRLPIDQHLIGYDGTSLTNIQTITSHPVALSQCDNYIATMHPTVAVMPYHDTSAAIEYVKRLGDPSVVAIGGEEAARLHGLSVLVKAVQNDPNNATTFKSLSLIH